MVCAHTHPHTHTRTEAKKTICLHWSKHRTHKFHFYLQSKRHEDTQGQKKNILTFESKNSVSVYSMCLIQREIPGVQHHGQQLKTLKLKSFFYVLGN